MRTKMRGGFVCRACRNSGLCSYDEEIDGRKVSFSGACRCSAGDQRVDPPKFFANGKPTNAKPIARVSMAVFRGKLDA